MLRIGAATTDRRRDTSARPALSRAVHDPRRGKNLRINGRAAISIDRDLCASFTMEGSCRAAASSSPGKRLPAVTPRHSFVSDCGTLLAMSDESSLQQQRPQSEVVQGGFDGESLRPELRNAQGNDLMETARGNPRVQCRRATRVSSLLLAGDDGLVIASGSRRTGGTFQGRNGGPNGLEGALPCARYGYKYWASLAPRRCVTAGTCRA